MRTAPDPSEISDVYIDESSQTNHRFLLLGGVIVDTVETAKLAHLITEARLPELPNGEPKWGNVSRSKLPAYRRIVDVLFDNPGLVHFHSLVVDTTRVDDRRFNDGSREIGFNKEIYQLANKFSRLYGDRLFHLYPDYRKTTHSPEQLRLILNRGRAANGDKRDWPFRRCHFRESDQCPPLQLVDIVLGALAYRLNGHADVQGASPPKIELSEYVLDRARVVDVTRDTARSAPFTIWHRRLRASVS